MPDTNPTVKRLSGENWLITEVDYWLEGHQKQRAPDPGWFHPSSIGGLCRRCLALEFLGYKRLREFEPRMKRIMDNGKYFHLRMTRLFRSMGILVAHDYPIVLPAVFVRGEADCLIRHPMGESWVVELKSMNTRQFSQIKEPTREYKAQITCYVHGTENTHKGIILIEDKDTQNLKSFIIEPSKADWADITTRLLQIHHEVVKEHHLPAPYRAGCACAEVEDAVALSLLQKGGE